MAVDMLHLILKIIDVFKHHNSQWKPYIQLNIYLHLV